MAKPNPGIRTGLRGMGGASTPGPSTVTINVPPGKPGRAGFGPRAANSSPANPALGTNPTVGDARPRQVDSWGNPRPSPAQLPFLGGARTPNPSRLSGRGPKPRPSAGA